MDSEKLDRENNIQQKEGVENEKITHWKRFLDRLSSFLPVKEVKYLITSLILLLVVSVAITSMTEIIKRQQFISFMSQKIEELDKEHLELYKQVSDNQSDLKNEWERLASVAKDSSIYTKYNDLERLDKQSFILDTLIDASREKINSYKRLKEDATFLYRNGTNNNGETLFYLIASERGNQLSESDKKFSVFSFFGLLDRLRYLNADYLIAFIVISCTVLGSLIFSFRQDKSVSLKNIALGIGTGFITFLAIKGGKSVFLLEFYQNDPVPLNPYSTAFVAILAGLFTDRMFNLLTSFVDQLSDHLIKSFNLSNNVDNGSSSESPVESNTQE